MDRDLSSELTGRMQIVPHETAGVDCCGCIIAVVEGSNVELRCNECAAVVGVVHIDILKGLLGLESAAATCPHCGKENTFPGFADVAAYVCVGCGKAVEPQAHPSGRVEINDDTCTWYEFDDGREPIAVMKCNRCGRHPNIDQDGVVCGLCGNRSPVRSADLEKVIEAWNAMVDPGE
jgi:DNA-directed RNA polymerase subunit RPC12/RpoP